MSPARPTFATRIQNGWLLVNCDVSGIVPVWISVNGGDFVPAYRDWSAGRRVAQIRKPDGAGRITVRLKVGDTISDAGVVDL